jgi:uncharacterized protein YjbI with pentapeptide repeats
MSRTRTKVDRQPLLWLVGAVSVSGTAVAGTATGVGAAIATAIGVLVVLATLGWALWRAAPNRQDAKTSLGTGLLVSVIVAAAVGSAQFAIDDRRTHLEGRRDLRLTIGLQRSLAGIDLSKQDLTGIYLAGKNLENARLAETTLAEAILDHARLCNAVLTAADLQHAQLFEADLRYADLRSSDLRGADLSGADLRWADLRGTKLSRAKLGADLRGASLQGTDVSAADLRAARVDDQTEWPDGFGLAAATRRAGPPAVKARPLCQHQPPAAPNR